MAAKKRQRPIRLAKLIASALPKGERPRAVVLAQTAVPTWGYVVMVVGLFLGGFGAMVAFAVVSLTRKKYVVTLTGTSVFVVRLKKRPFHVVAAYPHGAVPVSNVTPGWLWTTFDIQLEDGAAPVALQTDRRTFTTELDYIVAQADPALTEVDPWAEAHPTR